MAVSIICNSHFVGVLVIGALVFGVCIRTDFVGKRPLLGNKPDMDLQ